MRPCPRITHVLWVCCWQDASGPPSLIEHRAGVGEERLRSGWLFEKSGGTGSVFSGTWCLSCLFVWTLECLPLLLPQEGL
ncbi:hypothetical protein P153DRAFT_43537 [Dothidotthia symphoricarpi CBS 119687]|uniref:Uncharacterized protein n=1 Tax=Dothidotthia symphoricarpi CBS 119687 TaxID=1392245 RepID=A0A6A6A9L8_9PLEO|nr:uncharacterized protein P153DRAFT_43537 [Dothidotthia symphoricarpi CBS 119687]KAF2127893.1 hypothetical protein P153DRAFT_43537 [Dothidotthia symphoricarpi CBS 119687]